MPEAANRSWMQPGLQLSCEETCNGRRRRLRGRATLPLCPAGRLPAIRQRSRHLWPQNSLMAVLELTGVTHTGVFGVTRLTAAAPFWKPAVAGTKTALQCVGALLQAIGRAAEACTTTGARSTF